MAKARQERDTRINSSRVKRQRGGIVIIEFAALWCE